MRRSKSGFAGKVVSGIIGVVCTALTAACSSGGDESSLTDPAGSSPAGSTADGAVGAGDDAGTGGGGRRGQLDASSGGGASADVVAACQAAGQTMCAKANACSHFLFLLKDPDETTCAARYAMHCETQASAPGAHVTADFVQSCANATAAGSCNDLFDGVLPSACLGEPAGDLADGAACGEASQCANLDCRKPTGSYCGTCATPAKSGQSCASTDCAPGLICMSDSVCRPLVAAGASCSATQHCEFPLICKNGACTPPDTLGQSCSPSVQACDSSQGLVCDPDTSKCVAVGLTGSGGTCGVVSGSPISCGGGALCKFASSSAATGSCLAPAADHGSCSDTAGPGCMSPAFCSSGVCTLPDPTTCQ